MTVRVLPATEATHNCCFANECDREPSFEVALERGLVVACDAHVEELLPPGERAPAAAPPPPPVPGVRDIRDIFRAQDGLKLLEDELARRAFGSAPDPRFDPILDSILDLTDAVRGR